MLIFGFIYPVDAIPVLVVFVGFMISSNFRFVPVQVLLSRIPAPGERARFTSIQAAVESVAAAIGAMLGAQILTEHPEGSLAGIDDVAWLAIAMTSVYAALVYAIAHRVGARIAGSARHTPCLREVVETPLDVDLDAPTSSPPLRSPRSS